MLKKVLALQRSTHALLSQALGVIEEDGLKDRGGRRERINLNDLGDNVWLKQFRCDEGYLS